MSAVAERPKVEAKPKPLTAQQFLREWVATRIDGLDEVVTADLVTAAQKALKSDPQFAKALAACAIQEIIPSLAEQAFARKRMVVVGNRAISAEKLNEQTTTRLARWHEQVEQGVRRSLLAMNRPDLRYSIEQRSVRVSTEQRIIAFELDLHDGLPDDETKVGDWFSDDALTGFVTKHFKEDA